MKTRSPYPTQLLNSKVEGLNLRAGCLLWALGKPAVYLAGWGGVSNGGGCHCGGGQRVVTGGIVDLDIQEPCFSNMQYSECSLLQDGELNAEVRQ